MKEIRNTQEGKKVASFSIATSEIWRDKATGEKKENTEWIRCVAFGNLANILEQYVKKGSKVYVEGKVKTTKYTDASGIDKYTTDVVLSNLVMLDSKQG